LDPLGVGDDHARIRPGDLGVAGDDDAVTVSARPPGGSRPVAGREPLVEAKLAPPFLRDTVVPRDGLLRRLARADGGLVALVAPPGYGKTTSLGLWCAQERRPVGWLTCDAADADPIRFLTYLGLAIQRSLELPEPPVDPVGVGAGSALSRMVPRLTSTLHAQRRPLVLMVDDVHLLAGTPTIDALAMVVDYLPPWVTVAVAGRTHAGLPIARLRAGGRLLEVGVEDLALDVGEAGRLAALDGRRLDDAEAHELHERTEGWPAAVYLASLRRAGGAAGRDLSGRDADIGDYLDAELLDRVAPRTRAFLVATAVLDRMTPELCDAVVGGRGSDRLLRDLAAANQLVVPLDARGGWYRYHTLLREHLLGILERDPGAAAAAHRRAAAWFAGRGLVEPAVDHLFAAGDPDAAAAQACAAVARLFREGREVTFGRWLARLDDEQLRRQPFLVAMGAWMHTIQGRVGEAERMVDLMAGAAYGGERPAGADAYEEARDSLLALHARDGLGPALAHARAALADAEPLSAWRPQSMAVLGGLLMVVGERAEAEATLAEAASASQAIGAGRSLVFADAWRALGAIDRDDWPAADTLSRRSTDSASRMSYDPDAIAATRSVVAARVAVHRGELAEARRQMATFQVARAALSAATGWVSVRCLLEAARVHLALADPAGARSCLQQAGDILVRRPRLGALADAVTELRERIRDLSPGPGGSSTLTPAEIRVLRLLPTYLTAAEMAERLYVTPNTVRTQIQALYGKLGATSRAEAVEAAVEIGLLEPLPILAPGRITSL
jgi:LuxR family maltose regulon positive regulatory protein